MEKERLFTVPPHIQALWVETRRMRLKAQQTGIYKTREEEQRLFETVCVKPRMRMTAEQVISFMRELFSEDDAYSLLRKCEIEDKLKIALGKEAYRGNKEAVEVLEDLDLIASLPNAAFTQADEGYDIRMCHLVKDWEIWNNLKGKEEAELAFNGENVKVLSIIEAPMMSDLHWKIANELGNDRWWGDNYKYWKIWYNLRPVCHYYVWVGRSTRKPTRRTAKRADK